MVTLHDKSVQDARREKLAKDVAALTELSLGTVRARLSRAHGRTLLRNLFADAWPGADRVTPAPERDVASPVQREPAPRSTVGGPERTIHRVRQEFSTSCGVAVVAMFARVSHPQAMKVMFPEGGRVFYTTLKQVKHGLDHFGIKYGPRWHRCASWEAIPTTSLVKVKWQDAWGGKGLHWMIFQRRPDGTGDLIDPDPPRAGTQRLGPHERGNYTPITYLSVQARPPGGARRGR
jgi:hypothetical protein